MAPKTGGSVNAKMSLSKWDGQRLLQLSYFDRLCQFFQALPGSAGTEVECQHNGNRVFGVTVPLHQAPFAAPFAHLVTLIQKARKVAERFKVNPAWSLRAFNKDSEENVEQLYGIFFENGWREETPNIRVTAECVRKTFRHGKAKEAQAGGPVPVRITSDCTYKFLGEKIEAGRLVFDYSEVTITVKNGQVKKAKGKSTQRRKANRPLQLVLTGSKNTVMTIRKAEPADG